MLTKNVSRPEVFGGKGWPTAFILAFHSPAKLASQTHLNPYAVSAAIRPTVIISPPPLNITSINFIDDDVAALKAQMALGDEKTVADLTGC